MAGLLHAPHNLAAKGRNGDTNIAHMTPGEVVIPKEVAALRPDLVAHVANGIRRMGMDPSKYVVGSGRINPETGVEEFATEAEVRSAYQTVLGREPEAAGLAHWMQQDNLNTFFSSAQPELQARAALAQQTKAPAAPSAVTFTPSTPVKSIAPNAPNSTGYTSSNADAVKALAQGYTASKVNVNPESTVQGQLTGLLASGSPLNTQAETYGLQQANRRGLLNSSIAVGAAQDAVIRNALPIAQQDASTFANASTFNAGAENAASQFTAGAKNTAELQNAQTGTQVNLANASAANTAAQFTAAAKNTASLTDVENQMRLQLADLQANTQMSISDRQIASNQIISQGDNQTKLLLNQMDNAARLSLAQVDQDTKMKIAQMDVTSKANLTELEAKNRQLLQTNVNAANMFNQYVTNLANISTNTNMDATAKQTAMTNQLNALTAGLEAIGSISGLNLSQYFQASDISNTTQTQAGQQNSQPSQQGATPGDGGGASGGDS